MSDLYKITVEKIQGKTIELKTTIVHSDVQNIPISPHFYTTAIYEVWQYFREGHKFPFTNLPNQDSVNIATTHPYKATFELWHNWIRGELVPTTLTTIQKNFTLRISMTEGERAILYQNVEIDGVSYMECEGHKGKHFFLKKPQQFYKHIVASHRMFKSLKVVKSTARAATVAIEVYDEALISHLTPKLSWETAFYDFRIEKSYTQKYNAEAKAIIQKIQTELPLDEEFKFSKGQGYWAFRAFRRLEALISWDIPVDFRAFYTLKDGATNFIESDETDILSIEAIEKAWKSLETQRKAGAFNSKKITRTEANIQPKFWHQLWLPFARNKKGDWLYMDLQPTQSGKFGQVIRMNLNHGGHTVIASSFLEWLDIEIDKKIAQLT